MYQFLMQRLLQALATIMVVSIVVFLVVHLAGDPTALLLPDQATPADIARLRAQLGLDRPLHIQYLAFMRDFWRGEALKSFRYDLPVLPLVLGALRWTLALVGAALLIAVVVAIPLGTVAALTRGSLLDVAIRVLAVFGQSMPSFWVAMMLMLFIAVKLKLLPVSGLGWQHAILPIATLAFFQVAVLLRLFRSEMLEVIHQDYIRTARAKGLCETVVVYRHILKNTAIPVVTMVGVQFSTLITGAVVTEPIFAWPGVGFLLVNSVFLRDYPVVVGAAMVAAIIVTTVNLGVDILYSLLDPRIRLS
jgi:peptide/nickel transport system permease protein